MAILTERASIILLFCFSCVDLMLPVTNCKVNDDENERKSIKLIVSKKTLLTGSYAFA